MTILHPLFPSFPALSIEFFKDHPGRRSYAPAAGVVFLTNLYQIALQTVSPIKLKKNGEAGHVGCALETVGGVVFTGICIDVPCSIGICAEQAAIAEMLKNRETKIKRIVAVYEDGSILPPCGRCRELMSQLDLYNENTMVVVDFEKEVRLKELLPERWDKKWD